MSGKGDGREVPKAALNFSARTAFRASIALASEWGAGASNGFIAQIYDLVRT